MDNSKFLVILLVGIFLISLTNSEVFGYGRTRELPLNYSLIPSVNNSIFWDGNAYDSLKWLENGGGNVNQNLDISPYNFTADYLFGDGSQLTGIQATSPYPHDQNLNTTDNVTFVEVRAQVGNFTDLYVSNSTLYVGNVSMSSNNNTLYVEDNKTLFATFLAGDGSGLYNLDLTNVTIEGGNITAINFNGSRFFGNKFYGNEFIGGNFTGTDFYGGDFHGTYDWTAQFPWLNFNGTYLTFNESHLNQTINSHLDNLSFTSLELNGTTITDWSDVNYTVGNSSVFFTTPSVIGSYSIVLNNTFNFEIAQIIVIPSSTIGTYRFGMYESTGETIDADLINHKTTWNIFKSYPINNQISLNFSGVAPSKTFQVTIKYFSNIPS